MKSDVNPKDRQNFSSCLKLTSTDLFKILNNNVATRGTLIYLQILKLIIVAFIEKKTPVAERKCTYLPYSLSESGKLFIQNAAHVIKNFIYRASICMVCLIFLSIMVYMD